MMNISSAILRGQEGCRLQVGMQMLYGTVLFIGHRATQLKKLKKQILSAVRKSECNVTDQKMVINLSLSGQGKQKWRDRVQTMVISDPAKDKRGESIAFNKFRSARRLLEGGWR